MLSYVTEIRRELHRYPEIGFDLPRTLALVRRELTAFGIPYTESFGKSSIVATLGPADAARTVGIRADMDALPVTEQTGAEYASCIPGQMHACGHDAHTAILLDTARQLVQMKDSLRCRVKLIFQAAEEFAPSGAKLMAEDGVMDDIDLAVALHTEVKFPVGDIGLLVGPQNASSNGFMLEFFGKSAHAALQQDGVDAIAMAMKAYMAIELAVAKELAMDEACIFNVGSIHGGEANNVICDHAQMYCTLRAWTEATDEKMIRRIQAICQAVAQESGGEFRFTQKKMYPILVNNADVVEKLRASAAKVVGEEHIGLHKRSMGGEDFAYFARLKPCAMFRLGIRNEEKNCVYSAHQDRFDIDEDALALGSAVFVQFVKDQM